VRALLKCDAVQFRQTVVLPQGQFRRVIEDDETRARTLADLFDTGRFGAVQGDLEALRRLAEERSELTRLGGVLADEAAAQAADAHARRRLEAHGAASLALEALAVALDDDAVRLDELWAPLLRAAATQLSPGAPCPVCGSPEHPRALAVHDQSAALDGLQVALRSAQQTAIGAAAERVRQEERLRQALHEGGWAADALPAREALEAEARAAAERARAVADARREHGERSRRVEGLEPQAQAADQQLGPARQEQARAETDAARAGTLLEEAQERLGGDFDGAEAFHAALASARTTVAAFETEQRRRSEALQRARTAFEVATSTRDQAQRELEDAARRLEEASTEAHAALREHGFVAADGSASIAAFEAAKLSAEARTASERRVREHETSFATTTTRIGELEAALAAIERPDLDALGAARSAREQDRDAALEARGAAKRARDQLAEALGRWRELERLLGDREARARTAAHLSDLVNGTAAGQLRLDLRTYVLKRIMRNVLVSANVHLARMTGGRYQLRLRESAELRAHGLGLDVEDRHAGGARRRVATLSGGEGFQASLAGANGQIRTDDLPITNRLLYR
jgi:DNA repair protein SbcC/Rad50